jgi:hypothetical protein
LDVAILEDPLDNPLLTLVALVTSPLHALMSADHPAAGKQSVDVGDFGGVGWMMFQKRANPMIYDRVLEAAKEASVAPMELHHYMAAQGAGHPRHMPLSAPMQWCERKNAREQLEEELCGKRALRRMERQRYTG